jgi:hypothetical protein
VTDGLDQAFAAAGLDLLRAVDGLTVYDGAVPADVLKVRPVRPYVLVDCDVAPVAYSPDNPIDRVATTMWKVSWYCRCVGADAEAARAVTQMVRTALNDVRPSIEGVSCDQITLADWSPPDRDESTGQLVMSALRVYELNASV